MHAGFLRTGDRFLLAVRPNPTLHTVTPIAAVVLLLVVTRSSVQTGHGRTVADSRFAVGSGVTGRALASVRALSGVEASASVLAWFVVGAKVQILIAKQTTPAFVADTLPRLFAGSVHTSRVRFAFIAQRTLPSGLAYAFVGFAAVTVFLIASRSAAGFSAVITLPTG